MSQSRKLLIMICFASLALNAYVLGDALLRPRSIAIRHVTSKSLPSNQLPDYVKPEQQVTLPKTWLGSTTQAIALE